MYIKAFSDFSESNMEYSISFYFRQMWTDERLQFSRFSANDTISSKIFEGVDDLDVHPSFLEHIWQPDPAFTDFKEGKSQRILTPSKMLRIHRNGTVWYSTLLTLSVSCQMDLTNYPMDVQTCYMEFESFGYRTKNIKFKWKDNNPIEINDKIAIPQFSLDKHNVCPIECVRSYITGDFSCLRVTFYFYRQVGYHMLQTYLPSVLIVSLSWISFYVNPDAIPARVTVGITSVLTLTTQGSAIYRSKSKARQEMICEETCVEMDGGGRGARKELPAVSYVKAIDVWMTTCLTFVFFALLEFAVVNVLREREKKKAKRLQEQMNSVTHNNGDSGSGAKSLNYKSEHGGVTNPSSYYNEDDDDDEGCAVCAKSRGVCDNCSCQRGKSKWCWIDTNRLKARHVDHFSKVIFPTVFIIFNITYWSYYLASKYQSISSCQSEIDH